jgi:hypothetical protein
MMSWDGEMGESRESRAHVVRSVIKSIPGTGGVCSAGRQWIRRCGTSNPGMDITPECNANRKQCLQCRRTRMMWMIWRTYYADPQSSHDRSISEGTDEDVKGPIMCLTAAAWGIRERRARLRALTRGVGGTNQNRVRCNSRRAFGNCPPGMAGRRLTTLPRPIAQWA